jgi:AbrB family looped-hinge helix DNA binding protein
MGYGIFIPMRGNIVQIDQAGRMVLPKTLRDRFRLRGGDTLAIEVRGNAIELRPIHPVGQLKRVNGVLVFTGPAPLQSEEDLVARSRDERIDGLLRGVEERR